MQSFSSSEICRQDLQIFRKKLRADVKSERILSASVYHMSDVRMDSEAGQKSDYPQKCLPQNCLPVGKSEVGIIIITHHQKCLP